MDFKRDEQFSKIFPEDLECFNTIFLNYLNLKDENCGGAYQLAKDSLVMMNRFSNLEVQASKLVCKEFNKTDIKTFCHYKYKMLEYIHTTARMVWSRGEKNVKEG